jgi:hypothetical protein
MRKPKRPAAPLADEPLIGHLDDVDWQKFWGWACNPDDPDTPLWLEAAVDDEPPVMLLANRLRQDLAEAGHGRGCIGFHLYFPKKLDPRRPHRVSVRRASDGQELPGSPWLLPQAPAGSPEARQAFEAELAAEIEAAATGAELAPMIDFMLRQTDRLLQARCDTESGRIARAQFRLRWAETLGEVPMQIDPPDPRMLALFIGVDLPAEGRARAMVMALQALDLRVMAVAMRGLPGNGPAADALNAEAVAVQGAPFHHTVEDVLSRHAPQFRVILLQGAVAAAAYALIARLHHPNARIVTWLEDPSRDPKPALAAQLLSDVVITGTAQAAAECEARLRGMPVRVVSADDELSVRAAALAAAIRGDAIAAQ